ncbi:alkaline phosphatase [candidate division KSB1 bacterium]|nr:alkaline phosphatase [candidate division KSB1 bacterium]
MSRNHTIYLFMILIIVPLQAQHDPGRNAVRLLARGQIDSALVVLQKSPHPLHSPAHQAEQYFVQSLAACMREQNAEKFALQALQDGIAVERFRAWLNDYFSPLKSSKAFQAVMKQHKNPLLHGPMLGAVSDTSASFWCRTESENAVSIKVTTDNGTSAFIKKGRTSKKQDHTAIIRINGLEPNRRYRYRLFIDQQATSPWYAFRTFPTIGSQARFSIVFGGGAGFGADHEHMWLTIKEHQPLAMLMLGDNVYIDDPEHELTAEYCYYRRQSQMQWRQLAAVTPLFSIYDDHDFATDDCIPGPEIDTPLWKRKVWQTFRSNWNNPAYGFGPTQPGCWYDFMIADVHFIMLDCRYYRDLDGGSMLGPVQKKWLLNTLAASTGRFKVLASSVPWSPGVKPGSLDTWDSYADEREEIFSFIDKNRIDGVLLMAADRHRSDLRKIPRPQGYDFYEVMSSRLTNVHTHSLVEDAKGSQFIMGYNEKCSFGHLEFNTLDEEAKITYSIINIDGVIVDSYTIRAEELSTKN